MKFCPKCGAKNTDESKVCVQCQYPLAPLNETPATKKKKKDSILKTLLITFVSVIAGCLLIILTFLLVNLVGCDHEWQNATCTTPQTCSLCEITKGEATGEHSWVGATCTSAKTCEICFATEGEPKGHLEGEWKLTKEATLTETGTKEKQCNRCKETIASNDTPIKEAEVLGYHFNFKDEELIDWLNEIGNLRIGYTDIGDFDNENTMYKISFDGKNGGLILNHGNGSSGDYICGILVYFEDWNTAVAIGAWIAENIDESFSAEDSFVAMLNGEAYTDASMTLVEVDGIIALTTEDYLSSLI